jgi:hypothetical protein
MLCALGSCLAMISGSKHNITMLKAHSASSSSHTKHLHKKPTTWLLCYITFFTKCWYILGTMFTLSGLWQRHSRERNSDWKRKCHGLWATDFITTPHSTSRKSYIAWHLKQKNVSVTSAYMSMSNMCLLATLIQISVGSPY